MELKKRQDLEINLKELSKETSQAEDEIEEFRKIGDEAEFEPLVETIKEKLEDPEELRRKEIESLYENLRFSDISDTKEPLVFPKGFLWGTSTSAYQVEGGAKTDWSEWEKSPKRLKKLAKQKKDPADFTCGQGVDSYNRWEEDLDLAKDLNTNTIRLGIEWARLQPEKDEWDVGVLDHYRLLLEGAEARGLKTVVTLWHWTNPLWFRAEGGWENKKASEYFATYVEFVVKELGGAVDFWVTLNEPMAVLSHAYLFGNWPPNKKNPFKFFKATINLIKAHKRAYNIIHHHFPEAKVSITNLSGYFEVANRFNPLALLIKNFLEFFTNKFFLGRIARQLDYIGLDYYFHERVVAYPPFRKNLNKFVTDLGWEIYPEGIYHVLKDLACYGLPVIVLENGLADKDDRFRERFIKEHLYWVWRAIDEGVDVLGYSHWSLLDNFEWAYGWAPKFGLYEVDLKTLERKLRPSGKAYGEICKENSLQL